MRLQEIVGIVKEYFLLALIAVIVLGIIYFIGYFIVYRKLLGGKRKLLKKQLLFGGLFTGYVIMVLGVTFLNRSSHFQGGINLSFLSSYREAWYTFSVRHWQFVLLNIFMFVPFGILLPLLHSRFQRAIWTFGGALLFTLSIETFQLITSYGIFEVDDIFNNLLGAIIGYGIFMGIFTSKGKGFRPLFYFLPLLLLVISFGSMFAYYHLKEFGNLSIVPSHTTDVTRATISIDEQLDDHKKTVPIYKAPSYKKTDADQFVTNFFKRINLDPSNMEVISYQNEGVYWIRGEKDYNIWFQFLDGSYRYTDFTSFDDNIEPKEADEDTLKENVKKFGIDIPPNSHFRRVNPGTYEWTVGKKVVKNQLVDGSLTVNYYSDDTVKSIVNQLITYDKVRDIRIKSPKEAYKEILDGKFQYYGEYKMIKTLQIHKVEISYYLDSKGFYQPVYAFKSTINGMKKTILIPGF